MAVFEQQWRENYQEYLRLLLDSDYYDVTFDALSGGVSAIHRFHHFDKAKGPFGIKRGDYEMHVVDVLRKKGASIILLSEQDSEITSIKHCDALLNNHYAEIKTIESNGRWSVRTKIRTGAKQGANTIILYYPDSKLLNIEAIQEGWSLFESDPFSVSFQSRVTKVVAIAGERIIEIRKPSG